MINAPIKNVKRLFIDFETTGTNYRVHGIHQISGCIEINGKIVDKFDIKLRPFDGCEIDPEALAIGHLDLETVMSYSLSDKEAYEQLASLLTTYVSKFDKRDKFFFVGYNAHFDKDFANQLFVRNGDDYFFSICWSNHLDVMTMATEKLEHYRHDMSDFKLMSVAKRLGFNIQEEKLHDSSYDIELTRDVFYILKMKEESLTYLIEKNTPIIPVTQLDYVLTFGKHKDKSLAELLETNPKYLLWLNEKNIQDINFDADTLTLINSKIK